MINRVVLQTNDALEDHIKSCLPKDWEYHLRGKNVAGWQLTFKPNEKPVLTIKYKE